MRCGGAGWGEKTRIWLMRLRGSSNQFVCAGVSTWTREMLATRNTGATICPFRLKPPLATPRPRTAASISELRSGAWGYSTSTWRVPPSIAKSKLTPCRLGQYVTACTTPRISSHWLSADPFLSGQLNKQIAWDLDASERTDQSPSRQHHGQVGGSIRGRVGALGAGGGIIGDAQGAAVK